MFARVLLASALLALSACAATSSAGDTITSTPIPGDRQAFLDTCKDWDEWDKPAPPFRIFGGTYYVGTCGIAAILVTDDDGHVLIDTGTDEGAKVVLANIEKLGFDPGSVSTILMSHEHFDHIGGIARIQAATGGKIVASEDAAKVLRTGLPGEGDPQAESGHPPFPAIANSVDVIDPDAAAHSKAWRFTPIFTPGHTPGALSWQWRECEGDECRWLVYADSLSPISADHYRFSDHPDYVAAFRTGLADLSKTRCDILITPHPSASEMLARMRGENGLMLPDGCSWYPERIEARLDKRLAEEAAGG